MSNKGFYAKTKKGNIAHVLADENISEDTMQAIEKMIDIAYHKKGLGNLNKAHLNMEQQELTFGQKLVGLTFNPSGDEKVNKAKQLCADLADLIDEARNVNATGEIKHRSELENTLYFHTIGEILNAQMNVVKLLTLKY